ncbi:GH36-type glycosyl hydrolase domain-containing protein [Aminirod propionatiphilus]|uniref:Glycosyl transferase n=1 Tax=Aminirod propionatiphilus TaxID=3415223 RepID=A0ACD1DTY9_9BACT|nr:glycosyl transferase [Synergistota bacterium]
MRLSLLWRSLSRKTSTSGKATLIGYFVKDHEARKALKDLRRKGYRHIARVSRSAEGTLSIGDVSPWVRIGLQAAAFALFGGLSALLFPVHHGSFSLSVPVGGLAGLALSHLLIGHFRFGTGRKELERQARRLIPGETALVLLAPIEQLRDPMTVLLGQGEMAPTIFVLHPRRENPNRPRESRPPGSVPPNPAPLQEQSRRLARGHRLDVRPPRDRELLKRLERGRRWVQQVCLDLSEASRLLQSVPSTAEWLLDNEYLFEGNARDVSLNLPRRYYRQLPALAEGPHRGHPRIYDLARELVELSDFHLEEENILAFTEAYQKEKPLLIGELWALPQMLRMALIEGIEVIADRTLTELRDHESADLWANRLVTANRNNPNGLFPLMAELTQTLPDPSPHFAAQLVDSLYDEGAVLVPVRSWLEQAFGKSLKEILMQERKRQTKDEFSIGNAFGSLRRLALLDWKECFERLSQVEETLRRDPSGIYPRMDFATRDRYRRAVEDLRRGSDQSEEAIARKAVDLAAAPSSSEDAERQDHVGTYLIGEKRNDLAQLVGCRESFRFRALSWAHANHSPLYLVGLTTLTVTLLLTALHIGFHRQSPATQVLFALLAAIPASQIALELLNLLVMALFPPRSLPKMDFRTSGIPDAFRTLVVVPMLLSDEEAIKTEVEKLEIRFLANREENLLFALYPDYLDSDSLHDKNDETLLSVMTQSMEELEKRHGVGRFFLFLRERTWSESEQKFIGWERKRGKLEELNGLISGTGPRDGAKQVCTGDPERLADVRFVITLDSDTQLPPGSARRMIETLAHPLNQARLDGNGQVRSGYTLIQPRVSPSLPSTSGSPFSRLFSDPVGIDPYTQAISDVYQDMTGAGSYHGKGIYDVRLFDRILSGRFPEARLLSHDLIEGAHVRVGLASDIELFDEFPQDYRTYSRRQHRWIRGDWQIAEWIMARVPLAKGGRGPNPLSCFDRWKILDNLRRSLLPPASLALLVAAWFVSAEASLAAGVLVATQLFFHSLLQPFRWAAGRGLGGASLAKGAHDLLRVIVEAALLPHQSLLALDAVTRVVYRRLISHRKLLEWTSAQAEQNKRGPQGSPLRLPMAAASLFSLLVFGAVAQAGPTSLLSATPWLALWLVSPFIGWLLNRLPPPRSPRSLVAPEDRTFLRLIARRTWRYFSDFVDGGTSWLPPDNYQASYRKGLAMRTSPTNIALYLVSVLSARDFGYLTADGVVQTMTPTMRAIGKLERHEGHLLNWYDVQTGQPLEPRYVSAVDSGNLLGALLTLDQGLQALVEMPILDDRLFAGLHDTGALLRAALLKDENSPFPVGSLDSLLHAWASPPDSVADRLHLLRQTGTPFALLSEKSADGSDEPGDVAYWTDQTARQVSALLNLADRYLCWIEMLAEKTEEEIRTLAPEALSSFRQALTRSPSLKELKEGRDDGTLFLQALEKAPSVAENLSPWIGKLREALATSKWLAGEMAGLIEGLADESRELARSINMKFLYNTDRHLFSIGFNVSEGRLDRAFYDLLASEARLGSFIAIARGEIPIQHWFAMGRPYGAIGRRRSLLSWTGTMFEYLMPLLFQRSYDKTLLDKAAGEAVKIQIDFGRKHHVPWGTSECAFGDLDIQKTYQYQAFGVPELGLKRGLVDKIVVAPYATFLALAFEPREALQNLKRLAALGLLGEYGYYEAIDYSRRANHESDSGVIVHAYMAHHQGMSFLALNNFLHENRLRDHFHKDMRVRTVESLLYERIPTSPPLQHIATRERVSSVSSVGEAAPAVSLFDTPHTATVKTQILSNGRYGLMITAAGGGYSRWKDLDITRWQSDPTRDSQGSFCYFRDLDSGRLWCNTYHPTDGKTASFRVNFTLDRAVFHRIDDGIESETEMIVAPEDDVEIRRITLINRSTQRRRIELTSYVELALAPHRADRQHPAFSKLFVQTEALTEERALLAWRRTKSDDERALYVGHRLTAAKNADTSFPAPLRFETDRSRFIGRGHSLSAPMGALLEPGGSQGFVIDPILSLRHGLTLEPGERTEVSLILAAGSSRREVTDLMVKFGEPHAIDQAMDMAWASAQLNLRLLRIQPDEARRFQQIAGHILYPNALLRSAPQHIAANRKGQSGLWAYGLSGDLPLVLVSIGEARDMGLVRQILQAHAYWTLQGLSTDLVLLNEENSGYEQPLRNDLERLIQSHGTAPGPEQPGNIRLLTADLLPPEDLTLLRAVASVALAAARGTLPQQIAAAAPEGSVLPEIKKTGDDRRGPSAVLPFMELPFFNSLGGFTPDGREYVIYLGPSMDTPAPWANIMANPTFGTLVSETGAGFTWQGNSQRNRLTPWSNDPVLNPSSEAIYLRDEETGVYWTTTASPIREEGAYRARHGAGYTVFEHNSHEIDQELTVFVPVDDQGGEPIKLQRLALFNDSDQPRELSATYYVEWALGETREASQMQIVTTWDDEAQALVARNAYHGDYGGQVAFAAVSEPVGSYTGDRTAFLGRNRSPQNPAAMERVRLSRRTGANLDPCAALQVTVTLAPRERREIVCMLGQAPSIEAARSLVETYRDSTAPERALRRTQAWWEDLLGTIQVRTPELSADLMINRWLLYQDLSCRIWGRSGFYQSGGAFGFRDQLQDVMALLHTRPRLAREHILQAASRQFKEGDVQHWWHPPGGEGIRSRISDDLLWLPFVVARYVNVTADRTLLDELVPFVDAPLLKDDQQESFQSPGPSAERATLFEHCRRALAHSQRFGVNGLPLIGSGDWNDGMNRVGAGGKGESVWLGWFMVHVLRGMSEMADLMGLDETGRSFEAEREALIEKIEAFAWDGEWYRRATFDDGTLLGSKSSDEGQIFSLPQSWAWLSGAAETDRARKALDAAWSRLVRKEEGLVLLFDPPFDRTEPSPGYIQGYPPGVRENGGQYTHAALWLAMAMARSGNGTRATEILRLLNPIEHSREPQALWRYGVEPYVVAADIYRLPEQVGRGGWSWYTGSAAWMYRAWVEEILGLNVRGDTLELAPVIPGWWDGFQIRYRHGEAHYEIEVANPDHCERGVASVEIDGQPVRGGIIGLSKDRGKHRVRVRMGRPEKEPGA